MRCLSKLVIAFVVGLGLGACDIPEQLSTNTSSPAGPVLSVANPEVAVVQTATGFFYPTGTSELGNPCGKWLGRDNRNSGCYGVTPGSYHIGYDIKTGLGKPVYAISRGTVVYRDNAASWEYGNVGLLIQHTLSNGTEFLALYGHIKSELQVGDRVSGGVEIGVIGKSNGGNHLHFGISPGTSIPPRPWGSLANSKWKSTNGFVDPIAWITTRGPKCENGTAEKYRPGGNIPTHPNGSLLKVHNSPTIYVLHEGKRRGIPTAQRLYELYGRGRGFDFRDVITISSTEMNRYPLGPVVTAPLPYSGRREPDGRLIRQRGGGEISIVSDTGVRRPFSNPKAFLALGYTFCNVTTVTDYSSYRVGSVISR